MRIDHVLIASRDMEATAARLLHEHGLASIEGGRHPGWGTGNKIVPIGDQYLEIIGVADEAEARTSPLGQHVLAMTENGDRLMGWCIRPDDLNATAARLHLPIVPGSRARPDGVVLRWRLAGLPEAMAEPWLPFFISWDDMSVHPSTMPTSHEVQPTEIAWIEAGGDSDRLAAWLDDARLPARSGPDPRLTAVAIGSSGGDLLLRL